MQVDYTVVGDDPVNAGVVVLVGSQMLPDEQVVLVSGFDFGKKVVAVTNQRVLVGDEGEGLVLSVRYGDQVKLRRRGRSFVVEEGITEHRYRMGGEHVVEALLRVARNYQGGEALAEHVAEALLVPVAKIESAREAFLRGDYVVGRQWLSEAVTALVDVVGSVGEESESSSRVGYPHSRGADDAEKLVEYGKGFSQRMLEKLFSRDR